MRLTLHPTAAQATPSGFLDTMKADLRLPDATARSGWRYLYDRGSGLFAPGLLSRVYQRASLSGPVSLEDATGEPAYEPATAPYLYAHQQVALQTLLGHRRGILHSAPRSGKTVVASGLLSALYKHRPALFVVEREELLQQQREVLERFTGEPCGILQGGDISGLETPLAVGMIQTMHGRLEALSPWLRTVRLCIVDECHHAAAETYARLLSRLSGAWRVYGLSATPWRNDDADLLLEANVGPVLHRIRYSTLIRSVDPRTGEPFLVPPVVVFQAMPNPPEAVGTTWLDVHRQAVVKNDRRNQAVVDFITYMRARGKTTVVLVDRVEHGKTLANWLGCPFTRGESKSPQRAKVLQYLKAKELDVVVSTLYREAVDIPVLDAIVNAGASASSIQYYQAMRNLTPHPGKLVAPVLDFADEAPFLSGWAHDRKNYCEAEEAFINVHREDYVRECPTDPIATWGWLDPLLEHGIGFH